MAGMMAGAPQPDFTVQPRRPALSRLYGRSGARRHKFLDRGGQVRELRIESLPQRREASDAAVCCVDAKRNTAAVSADFDIDLIISHMQSPIP
jgi:hypothetical protein